MFSFPLRFSLVFCLSLSALRDKGGNELDPEGSAYFQAYTVFLAHLFLDIPNLEFSSFAGQFKDTLLHINLNIRSSTRGHLYRTQVHSAY